MISTFIDHVQKAIGRRFFVTAFLPTVVVAAVGSIQVWGVDAIRGRITVWTDKPAGSALFDMASTIVILFLVAYVFDSLRWSVRAVFEGTWPAPLRGVREYAVLRMVRRSARRTIELEGSLDRRAAIEWLRDGLGPVPYVEPFESEAKAAAALNGAARDLEALKGKPVHNCVNRVIRGTHCLWRLEGNRGQVAARERELDDLRALTKQNVKTRGAMLLLEAAYLRVEQRRVWLDERLELSFPDTLNVQPTQLGNVMARADSYSATRYGIPLRELWPRLEIFASDSVLAQVDDSLSRIDFGLAMTMGGLVLTVLGTASFLRGGPGVSLLLAGASFGACVLAYRFAVLSGEAYARRVSAAVDIFRRETLRSLGVEPPLAIADEQRVWDRIHHFLARGDLFEDPLVRHGCVADETKKDDGARGPG